MLLNLHGEPQIMNWRTVGGRCHPGHIFINIRINLCVAEFLGSLNFVKINARQRYPLYKISQKKKKYRFTVGH